MKSLFNFKSILPLLALLVVVGIAPIAQAEPIAPGTTIPGPSFAAFFGGTVLGHLTTPVIGANIAGTTFFTGIARTVVVRNAGGLLDFYYQFSNAGPSSIARTSMGDYDGFITEVFNILNGSAINSATGCLGCTFLDGTEDSVSASRSLDGNVVSFNYGPASFGALTTNFVTVVLTNATEFRPGDYNLIDGATGTAPAFAPGAPAAIPEPASMLLLGTGLIGTAGVIRRRFKVRSSN